MCEFWVPNNVTKNAMNPSITKGNINMYCLVVIIKIKWWTFFKTKPNMNTMVETYMYLLKAFH